jgi:hypothetical protein
MADHYRPRVALKRPADTKSGREDASSQAAQTPHVYRGCDHKITHTGACSRALRLSTVDGLSIGLSINASHLLPPMPPLTRPRPVFPTLDTPVGTRH